MPAFSFSSEPPLKTAAPLIVLGAFEGAALHGTAAAADKALGGALSSNIKAKRFTGEFKTTASFTPLARLPSGRLLVLGLGKRAEFSLEKFRQISALAAKTARALNLDAYATALMECRPPKTTPDAAAQAIAEGASLATYQFSPYLTDPKRIKPLRRIILHGPATERRAAEAGLKRAAILARGVAYVRDLVNEPAAVHSPQYLEQQARKVAREHRLRLRAYDAAGLKKLGMGGLLGVGQGSAKPPRFLVLDYNPGKKPLIAVVGKGITFDSGGLDLKPAKNMEDMKHDMAGAAAVLGIMSVLRPLKVKCRVIGLIPAAENMPGPNAYRPGDILTAYNKKTVEVLNTDAEGRLILMDALAYADSLKPDVIIDLATLTGAIVVALGPWAAGLFGDAKYGDLLLAAGEACGERCWRMPLWDDHQEMMKGTHTDLKNIADQPYAGSIQGAAFLKNFVTRPWVHLDIAGTAWTSEERDYEPKGATGWGVRLLAEFLERVGKKK